jgi:hypothetical protein
MSAMIKLAVIAVNYITRIIVIKSWIIRAQAGQSGVFMEKTWSVPLLSHKFSAMVMSMFFIQSVRGEF